MLDFEQTKDKGFIITGYVENVWPSDSLLIIKTDSLGEIQWEKAFAPQIPNRKLIGSSCFQNPDLSYQIYGGFDNKITSSMSYDLSYISIIVDQYGNRLSSSVFKGNCKNTCFLYQDEPQHYGDTVVLIINDSTYRNFTLSEIEPTGAMHFSSYSFKASGYINCNPKVCRLSDKGYLLYGNYYTDTNPFGGFHIAKLDSNLNLIWSNNFYNDDKMLILNASEDLDGNILLGGQFTSHNLNQNSDGLLIKIDQSCNLIWANLYFTSTVQRSIPNSISNVWNFKNKSYLLGVLEFNANNPSKKIIELADPALNSLCNITPIQINITASNDNINQTFVVRDTISFNSANTSFTKKDVSLNQLNECYFYISTDSTTSPFQPPSLSPNPIDSEFEINFDYGDQVGYVYEIIDSKGAVIVEKNNVHSHTRLNASDFSAGIFFIRIVCQENQYCLKFIKL